ncbi:MAG: hypothetical protein KJO76_09065 [Gammaproteobacteria bacterium]|nr:hypothetical protein [Gammaproteobacteria bacterium]MBT8443540.1 hypothetical protein [Gammaproteobacteria bacterium]NND37880.1 hypothetical protein [Gammaproteobacteria bacterium]
MCRSDPSAPPAPPLNKALGGGWQLRQGNNYIDEDIRTKMAERTNWGEYLESSELPEQGDIN